MGQLNYRFHKSWAFTGTQQCPKQPSPMNNLNLPELEELVFSQRQSPWDQRSSKHIKALEDDDDDDDDDDDIYIYGYLKYRDFKLKESQDKIPTQSHNAKVKSGNISISQPMQRTAIQT